MDKKNTPEVKLGQYKGLAVTRHVRPVTDMFHLYMLSIL